MPTTNNLNVDDSDSKFEKFKFWVEIIKWFIASVLIVIITTIIDRGFKERSAGILEMQAYDKYVEIILKADNIEERWKLAQYFSIVTPTDRLRDKWISYKDSISKDYTSFKILKQKEFDLQKQKNASLLKDSVSKFDTRLNEIQNKLAPFQTKLNAASDFNSAQTWEKQGFQYLLNKDVDNAILAFINSENEYNSYHQVYEIAKYLTNNRLKLIDPNNTHWKITFKKIGTDYSWGMPLNLRNQILEYSK